MFSVVAAIYLPLGFLTGQVGINLGGVSGVENPYAFWISTALCVILFSELIFVFKKFVWL